MPRHAASPRSIESLSGLHLSARLKADLVRLLDENTTPEILYLAVDRPFSPEDDVDGVAARSG